MTFRFGGNQNSPIEEFLPKSCPFLRRLRIRFVLGNALIQISALFGGEGQVEAGGMNRLP